MPVIPPFARQTRAPQTAGHDPNDPVRGGLRTGAISNERASSRARVCSFSEALGGDNREKEKTGSRRGVHTKYAVEAILK